MTPSIPSGCIACSTWRLTCDSGQPACARCITAGQECSYNWTLGPHIFRLFGPRTDIGWTLKTISEVSQRGAFGHVYQVRCRRTRRLFAVKVLYNHAHTPARSLQLCLREACTWWDLQHPNITELAGLANYGRLVKGGLPQLCMVSPWAMDGSVWDYIQAHDLSWKDTLTMLWDIASGLEYLHSFRPGPIIHGDLKANNVLLFREKSLLNGRMRACLVDFGLSRVSCEEDYNGESTSTGAGANPRFIAWERMWPERCGIPRMSLALTTHSDVFEMMRTFLQILTKKLPYHYLNSLQLIAQISSNPENPQRPSEGILQSNDGLWNMMLRCWKLRRDERPSVREVKIIIEYYIIYESVQPTAISCDTGSMVPCPINLSDFQRHLMALVMHYEAAGDSQLSRIWDSLPRLNSKDDFPSSPFNLKPSVFQMLYLLIPSLCWNSSYITFDKNSPLLALTIILQVPQKCTTSQCSSQPSDDLRQPSELSSGQAPILSMCIHTLPLLWISSSLSLLEHLEVRMVNHASTSSENYWINLLGATTSLRTLIITGYHPGFCADPCMYPSWNPRDSPDKVIHLPQLYAIRLKSVAPTTIGNLLTSIRAISLVDLHLQGLHLGNYQASLHLLEHNRFPQLSRMKILDVNWHNPVFFRLLGRLDRLKTLELSSGDMYLEGLIEQHSRLRMGERPLMPSLHTLQTHGYTCDVLREFYNERNRLGFQPMRLTKDHPRQGHDCCRKHERYLQKKVWLEERYDV